MPRLQKAFFTFCSLFFLLLQTVGCDDTTDDPNPSAESNGASVTQVDVDTAALAAFDEGVTSVDITSDNQGAFEDGVESVDITSDNQGVYDEGFTAGVDSVDITSNDEAMCEDIGGTYVTCDYPTGNADDPDFDAGFGPCSTYAPGEINEAFCNEDVDEFGVLAAEACPTSCQVVEPGPQAECELLDEPYCSIDTVLQEGYSSGYSVGYDQGVASVPVPLPTHGECFTMGLCGSQGFKKGKYKDYTSTDAANAAGSYCSDAYNDGKKCKNVSGACTTMNGKSNYCVD